MANQLARNPLVIDTAGGTILKNGWSFIVSAQWSGYSSAAHTCTLGDATGTFFTTVGKADLSPIDIIVPGQNAKIRDLKVTALGSGIVTVYLA